jgi:hypothetical protein
MSKFVQVELSHPRCSLRPQGHREGLEKNTIFFVFKSWMQRVLVKQESEIGIELDWKLFDTLVKMKHMFKKLRVTVTVNNIKHI